MIGQAGLLTAVSRPLRPPRPREAERSPAPTRPTVNLPRGLEAGGPRGLGWEDQPPALSCGSSGGWGADGRAQSLGCRGIPTIQRKPSSNPTSGLSTSAWPAGQLRPPSRSLESASRLQPAGPRPRALAPRRPHVSSDTVCCLAVQRQILLLGRGPKGTATLCHCAGAEVPVLDLSVPVSTQTKRPSPFHGHLLFPWKRFNSG